ncbi:MAG: thymidine phosphorylase, partial [Candidatus Pacearchaeota archaeon]
KLKIKLLRFSAGRPVAIISETLALKTSIHVDDRVLIKKNSKSVVAVVDVAREFVKENEIAVSSEIVEQLNLSEEDFVSMELAPKPESVWLIQKKLKCGKLTKEELLTIMNDISRNALTEAEIAYFVSAVYRCNMSIEEIRDMTLAIFKTGKTLGLNGEIVDKHSIGGIPGRITPILVSICAAAGLIMPKTSSRSITTPAGTADAMETICKVDFTIEELKNIIKKTNACIVWGGALNLAPADDKIIQVEKLLNLDPEPQLLASILAKKMAVGAKYVLIDIPFGKNAKVTEKEANHLAKKFKKLANYFQIKLDCSLKKTEEPLGNGIGPALEIRDVIKVLKRENSCYKIEERALELSGKLLEMTGKAKKGCGVKLAKEILNSGQAFKKFKEIIEAQKGMIDNLKEANFKYDIVAEKNGKIKEINIRKINILARLLGCPADKYAGIYLHKHLNDYVKKGEKIMTLYSESKTELEEGLKFYSKNNPFILK